MQVLLSLSVALLVGLMLSRLAKLVKLPAVTAYLVAGILVGPYLLGQVWVPGADIHLGFCPKDFEKYKLFSDVAQDMFVLVFITLVIFMGATA